MISQSLNGNWTLKVTDNVACNTGTLVNWIAQCHAQSQRDQCCPSRRPSVNQPIPDATASTISSTLPIIGYANTFTLADLAVRLNVSHTNDSNLGAVLIAPDGITKITLFTPGTLAGQNLTNTVFSNARQLADHFWNRALHRNLPAD